MSQRDEHGKEIAGPIDGIFPGTNSFVRFHCAARRAPGNGRSRGVGAAVSLVQIRGASPVRRVRT